MLADLTSLLKPTLACERNKLDYCFLMTDSFKLKSWLQHIVKAVLQNFLFLERRIMK